MIIREIRASDAERFAILTGQIEAESDYMLWEAGERIVQVEQQLEMIEDVEQKENSTILVAESDSNELIGFLMAIGGNARRNKHSAYIVMGILKNYRGRGIGTIIFEKLEQWSFNQDIHRLELTVVTRNKAAISLYEKVGFEIEGTKRHSLIIDTEFVDEYYMSKLL